MPAASSRRVFFQQVAAGAGGLALLALAACQRVASETPQSAAIPSIGSHPTDDPSPAPSPTPNSQEHTVTNTSRARQTYAMMVKRFNVPKTGLFFEHVEAQADDKAVSYLWPYSAVISGVNALARIAKGGKEYYEELKLRLDGLNAYYDKYSTPTAYDSYIKSAGGGDKFYDDNEWLGLEFLDAYRTLHAQAYLDQSKEMFRFATSGWSVDLGGGIYWKQNDTSTRNTCSNGPAAVLALGLYQETKDASYLEWAKKIMQWLEPLKSPDSGIYWDHITQDGMIDKRAYTYNVGTPLQAYALLYDITKEAAYLDQARALAAAGYAFFAKEDGNGERIYPATPWFNAVLLRGYIALYEVDPAGDLQYIQSMQKNLDYAWDNARSTDGSFSNDWTGKSGMTSNVRALIDQGAMVELYARLTEFKD